METPVLVARGASPVDPSDAAVEPMETAHSQSETQLTINANTDPLGSKTAVDQKDPLITKTAVASEGASPDMSDPPSPKSPAQQADPLITESMLAEEQLLHKKTMAQEEELKQKREEAISGWDEDVREHRYKRLQFLLSKSQMYTSYLVKRMHAQAAEEEKRKAHREKRLVREAQKKSAETSENETSDTASKTDKVSEPETEEVSDPKTGKVSDPKTGKVSDPNPTDSASSQELTPGGTDSTVKSSPKGAPPPRRSGRRSCLTNSQQSNNSQSNTSPGQSKRGRKRKQPSTEDAENYKISDYFTEALARSKRKKTGEDGADQATGLISTDKDTAKGTTDTAKGTTDTAKDTTDIAKVTTDAAKVTTDTAKVTTDTAKGSASTPIPDTPATTAAAAESKETDSQSKEGQDVSKSEEKSVVKPAESERMFQGEKILAGQPDFFTGGVLRQYQLDGFSWLRVLYENGVNGILADEMGLGKTIQCIALISHLVQYGVTGPFLVCCPLSTVPNWVSEFARFAPKVPVILYHGAKEDRVRLRKKIGRPVKVERNLEVKPVVITSYEISMNDRRFMQNHEWKLLIVDEGHRIKNFQCKLIQELKQYRAVNRLLLTGTPLQNNLAELWSLLNFLLPEIFDDLGSFEAWFDMDYLDSDDGHERLVRQEQRENVLSMLHQVLMPFMLRRLKTDVALAIPPKREVLVYAPLMQPQDEIYRAVINKTIKGWVAHKQGKDKVTVQLDEKGRPKRRAAKRVNYEAMLDMVDDTDEQKKGEKKEAEEPAADTGEEEEDEGLENWVNMVNQWQRDRQEWNSSGVDQPDGAANSELRVQLRNTLWILRKSCNHPYLVEYPLTNGGEFKVDEQLVKCSGKMLLLDKMLQSLKQEGHKVLLFSQMTTMLDVLEDYCYLRKYDFCRLDGSTSLEDRGEQIEAFNKDPERFLFLLSTRAGGLGINLTAADTVIIFDSDWNPQCDLQAQDRCHRIGQTRPVMIYRLITINTIDQRIVERAATKRRLEKIVIHKGKFKEGMGNSKEGTGIFSASATAPLTPQELINLLKSTDYDEVVKGSGEDVISPQDLRKLMDRDDLCKLWKQRQARSRASGAAESAEKPEQLPQSTDTREVAGVFKVISEDMGQDSDPEPGRENSNKLFAGLSRVTSGKALAADEPDSDTASSLAADNDANDNAVDAKSDTAKRVKTGTSAAAAQ